MNIRTEPKKELISAKWGFTIGPNVVINSRDDKIESSKTYQHALESARCLVPANGFYEWKTIKGQKIPYYFTTIDQGIISFAGFYQYVQPPVEYKLGTTIVTTRPNEVVNTLHDRMPVILDYESEQTWLDQTATKKDLLDCLVPYQSEQMRSYPVTKKVNSVKNSSPDMIKEQKPVVKKDINQYFRT